MDIAIKIFFSAWVVLFLSLHVYSWCVTWARPNISSKANNNFVNAILFSIVLTPHSYLIYCALLFLNIPENYHVFIFFYIGINKYKEYFKPFQTTFITGTNWEFVLYIPGIIYIFQH